MSETKEELEILKKKSEGRLSYSSASLLTNCEQRYYHYKVAKTPQDPDYQDNYAAFDIGKAFHSVLENTLHKNENIGKEILKACKVYGVQDSMGMIHAMVLTYLSTLGRTDLKCVFAEMEILDKQVIAFIDAVMKDDEGNWYILDLKTAAREDGNIKAKLMKDTQLNIYASYAETIAKSLKLDPKKFKGAIYSVTTKRTLVRKKTETYPNYVARLMDGQYAIKSKMYIIPVSLLKPKEVMKNHARLFKRADALKRGTVKPTTNSTYCFSYFRPCPYYSQCYGVTVTESRDMIKEV